MKTSFSRKVFQVTNIIILVLFTFSVAYPFWRILVLSLNEGIDAMRGGLYWWPRKFTLDNYLVIFSRNDIISAYKVTIGRTVIGTLTSVFLMALMAYGLSKKNLKGRNFINLYILITMFFSGGLVPFYLLLVNLKLYNNFWVYIIPALYQVWNIVLLRTFFMQLPASLEESARIDGANDLVVFFKIVLPLSMPIIATISLFVAVTQWNDWFSGTVYVQKRSLLPMQNILMSVIKDNNSAAKFLQSGSSNLGDERIREVTSSSVKMSTLIVTIAPIMCVYPFLQKYFIKGVMLGSIKG